MCVIVHCETKRPSAEQLQAMACANSAGGGVAWFEPDEKNPKLMRVHWDKGHGWKEIDAILDKVPLPAVIHFRLATVGGEKRKLCHPFPMTPEAELFLAGSAGEVLFHNGHCHQWEDFAAIAGVKLKGDISDTRAIAAICGARNSRAILDIVKDKFAVMSGGRVFRYGFWTSEDGMHFSNKFWENRCSGSTKHYKGYTGYVRGDYDEHFFNSPPPSSQGLVTGFGKGNGKGESTGALPVGENGNHHAPCRCKRCMADWRLSNHVKGKQESEPFPHSADCKCDVCFLIDADKMLKYQQCECYECDKRRSGTPALTSGIKEASTFRGYVGEIHAADCRCHICLTRLTKAHLEACACELCTLQRANRGRALPEIHSKLCPCEVCESAAIGDEGKLIRESSKADRIAGSGKRRNGSRGTPHDATCKCWRCRCIRYPAKRPENHPCKNPVWCSCQECFPLQKAEFDRVQKEADALAQQKQVLDEAQADAAADRMLGEGGGTMIELPEVGGNGEMSMSTQ